jgi:homoserine dehydrogenase
MTAPASRQLRIGLLGAGVVGQGILQLLLEHAPDVERRLGASIDVRRVAARDRDKPRNLPLDTIEVGFDPMAVVEDPDIDIVVEVMGGLHPAGTLVREALLRGKSVVTANKALLAEEGYALIELAEAQGVDLYFEAAVAGGIPVVRVLREALASDSVVALRGIVNGTSNYILSRMRDAGLDFADALAEAQERGYAEADPTLDVSGGDAAHKLAILATLAFGARVPLRRVHTEGIDQVEAIDMEYAKRFGFVIKPLAIGRERADGALELRVHPALVPEGSVLANVSGALNAVYLEGAMLGPCLLSGYGAGALPTAMSVVSDIVDVGRNLTRGASGRVPQFALSGEHLEARRIADIGALRSRYYLRFRLDGHSTLLARIASVLGAFDVGIEQLVQLADPEGDEVDLVVLTGEAEEARVQEALDECAALGGVHGRARALRIEASAPVAP